MFRNIKEVHEIMMILLKEGKEKTNTKGTIFEEIMKVTEEKDYVRALFPAIPLNLPRTWR